MLEQKFTGFGLAHICPEIRVPKVPEAERGHERRASEFRRAALDHSSEDLLQIVNPVGRIGESLPEVQKQKIRHEWKERLGPYRGVMCIQCPSGLCIQINRVEDPIDILN